MMRSLLSVRTVFNTAPASIPRGTGFVNHSDGGIDTKSETNSVGTANGRHTSLPSMINKYNGEL
jgi:hypothetical protein